MSTVVVPSVSSRSTRSEQRWRRFLGFSGSQSPQCPPRRGTPPEEPQPSRPASLRPGLTIYLREGHLREDGIFRPAAASLAFPGWTADEIHAALNEPELSAQTAEVLSRVGRTLGAAEGTGPDGDPFLRHHRQESRAEGRVEGRAAGRAEGRAEALRASALQVLASRGVSVSASLSDRLAAMEGVSERLVAAALECRDEEDFLRLLSAT